MTAEPQKEYIITEARLYQMEHGYKLKTNAKEVRLCPYNAKSSEAVLDGVVPSRLIEALEILAKTESWIAMNTFIKELRQKQERER